MQARWPDESLSLVGDFCEWSRVGDSGRLATYRFCGDCGATLVFFNEGMPGVTAVPVGAFADPGFPAPIYSVYEERKHPWVVVLGDTIKHLD